MSNDTCQLCDLPASIGSTGALDQRYTVICKRCGKYEITDRAINAIKGGHTDFNEQLYLVSGITRQLTENNLKPLYITTDLLYEQDEFQAKILSVVPSDVLS